MKNVMVLGVMLYGLTGPVGATQLSFPGFSDTSSLMINGTAAAVDNQIDPEPVLRLVEPITFSSGSFFVDDKIEVTQFSTHFTFRITPGLPNRGTDGLVFVLQANTPAFRGQAGGNLGFNGLPIVVGPPVGVEFDTWNNAQDPGDNHIGIDIGNTASLEGSTVFVSPLFDDGNLWHAWIDYDATTLEVRTNQTGIRPSEPLLAYEIDLPSELSIGDPVDEAYVGFSSATGGLATAHDLVSWTYLVIRPGDANRDGRVDAADLNILALNWQQGEREWEDAEFTGDGTVDAGDLNLLALNWQFGVDGNDLGASGLFNNALGTARPEGSLRVPEPGTLLLLGFTTLQLYCRNFRPGLT